MGSNNQASELSYTFLNKFTTFPVVPRTVDKISQTKMHTELFSVYCDDARYFGIQRGYIEFLLNKANILTERAVETTYSERQQVVEKLKEKYDILQEVTKDTKKVARAMAELKHLKN